MCHYVTAVFPRDADLDAARTVLDRHKFGFAPIENPYVQAQLQPGYVQILTTRGMCDCGTPLASENDEDERNTQSERILRKLRAKGWSEARIQRWCAEKTVASEKAARAAAERRAEGRRQVEQWVDLVTDLLTSGASERVGILVHWYSGRVESERIDLGPTTCVFLNELSPDALLEMREDAVFEVRAPA